MARDYAIQLNDNSELSVTGTTLKVGKGKNATEVVGLRRYGSGLEHWYALDHIPSGVLIAGGFRYQAIARHVGQVLIDILGERMRDAAEVIAEALDGPLEDYIHYMQQPSIQEKLNDIKRSKGMLPTLEDFANGPYYESLLRERSDRAVLIKQDAEYRDQLLVSGESLGWLPSPDGAGLDADELGALIEGRRTPSEVILYSPTGKGNKLHDA